MSTALYRRYRPESFAEIIGQEHVTEPLIQALRSGWVTHAYLFSGPRGCGKTTSARIMARCLNCEQGPTPEPCGTCESCIALARDGAGTIDVIEIDAASHGGVDDARDLRERAAFGPAQSRYKIYIIDEAHMVTPHGFNALLKVVEEPPPHVKFIFATTEPDKVLATIRSRTHHYPFHLVPPQRLTTYLEQVSASEGVALEPGVLSFVTRAGGGSVRDSLSVLDQLISGAGEEGLTYERTAALLGFTDVELLDAVVDAIAASDGPTAFAQVDKVMESGHDPRRFVEDLLERYRDLIVLAAVGDQAGGMLPGLPEDQVERMRRQAHAQGPAALSRAADLVSQGLSEMGGAVSFRLLLELLIARLLLPAAEGEHGYGVRLDRLERRLNAADGGAPAEGGAGPQVPPVRGQAARAERARDEASGSPAVPDTPEAPLAASSPVAAPDAPEQVGTPGAPASAPGVMDTAALRRQWPDILHGVKEISQRTWSGLETVQLLDFDGRRVLLGKPDPTWMTKFLGTRHEETLKHVIHELFGLRLSVEAIAMDPQGGWQRPQPTSGPASAAQPPTGFTPPPFTPPPGTPPPGTPPPFSPPGGRPPGPVGAGPSASDAGQQFGDAPPTGQPFGDTPPVGQPSGDTPPVGRLRTRGSSAPQEVPSASGAPVRVRGQGRAMGQPDAPGASTAPSMAEQLGATPAGPRTENGPDWSSVAATTAAPDWATADDPAADAQGTNDPANAAGTRDAGSSGNSQDRPAAVLRTRRPAGQSPGTAADVRGAGEDASSQAADIPSDDDEDLESSGAVGQPVIENVLGGTVIAINDDPVG